MTLLKVPVIGLVLLGLLAAQEDGDWDLTKQKAAVEGWEKEWRAVDGLMTKGGDGKDEGLDRYADLRGEVVRDLKRISDKTLGKRVEDLEAAMLERYAAIKWLILERLVRQGHKVLAVMDSTYMEKKYEDVLQTYEEDLEELAELMVAVDDDFHKVADDLREKGKVLRDDAAIGIEFRSLGLQIVSIDISENRSAQRSAVILHRKEKPPADARDGWKPEGRRYVAGDQVHQLPSVKIGSIHRNRVVCIYKEKYSIDLLQGDGQED
jgi:hypothetical protein